MICMYISTMFTSNYGHVIREKRAPNLESLLVYTTPIVHVISPKPNLTQLIVHKPRVNHHTVTSLQL